MFKLNLDKKILVVPISVSRADLGQAPTDEMAQ